MTWKCREPNLWRCQTIQQGKASKPHPTAPLPLPMKSHTGAPAVLMRGPFGLFSVPEVQHSWAKARKLEMAQLCSRLFHTCVAVRSWTAGGSATLQSPCQEGYLIRALACFPLPALPIIPRYGPLTHYRLIQSTAFDLLMMSDAVRIRIAAQLRCQAESALVFIGAH